MKRNSFIINTDICLMTLIAFLIVAANLGCKSLTSSSDNKNFVASSKAQNSALLLMGSATKIPGVYQDPPNMANFLKSKNFNFTNMQLSSAPETKQAIIQKSAEAAKALLQSPNSTLLWYFSGHGSGTEAGGFGGDYEEESGYDEGWFSESEDLYYEGYEEYGLSLTGSAEGSLIAEDGGFTLGEVIEQMKLARNNVPIHRLIVIVDACFSGTAINQLAQANPNINATSGMALAGPINRDNNQNLATENLLNQMLMSLGAAPRNPASPNYNAAAAADPNALGYEQLVIITASNSTETSSDSSVGGVATNAFIDVMNSLSSSPVTSTLKHLQEQMESSRNALGQSPKVRIFPQNKENELLFVDQE